MSDTRRIVLRAQPATHDTFRTFGFLPVDEGTAHDDADIEFTLNDGHVNYIAHTRDEVPEGAAGLQCELLNRHDTHTQTLMPVDTDAIVVVAPADVDFSESAHFDTVRAFLIPRYTAVSLKIGTWHWGPYPVAADSVRIFNVQGRGYVDDNGIAWLARDHATVYEVDTTAG